MALGDRIKKKREAQGMTLKQLAEMVGVKEAIMSRYESNKIKNPSHNKIMELAKALHTDVNYLMDWDDKDVDYESRDNFGALAKDEKDLVYIFRALDRRAKTELLGKAFELERLRLQVVNRDRGDK